MSNWKLPASTPEELKQEDEPSQSKEQTDEENKQIEDAAEEEEEEVVDMDEFIEEVERKED